MKISLKRSARVYELVVIVLVLFIVFFVLFAVHKNVGGLASIKSIDHLTSYRKEGFHGRPNLEYSSYPQGVAMDSMLSKVIDKSNQPSCGKVWGFNGLFCGLGVADNTIDPFYKTKSDMTCAGSGITKSGGNVCLDDTQMQLLTTRGGNSV